VAAEDASARKAHRSSNSHNKRNSRRNRDRLSNPAIRQPSDPKGTSRANAAAFDAGDARVVAGVMAASRRASKRRHGRQRWLA
jgi:hypothetical protein